MSVYYLDTSALAKRYIVEVGTAYITEVTDPAQGNEVWIATIAWVELVAALYRRANLGDLPLTAASSAEQNFRHDLHQLFHSWELTPRILAQALSLAKRHALRAYDAIQLASALDLHFERTLWNLPRLTFLSADQTLNQAALAEGLLVDDPNRHP